MKTFAFTILASFILGLTSAASSFALDTDNSRAEVMHFRLREGYNFDQCSELVKECFSIKDTEQKNSCFHGSAQNLFCQSGALGKLIYKRWAITAGESEKQELSAEMPNPVLVDQTCLQNFDNQVSANLIGGSLAEQAVGELSNSLGKCVRSPGFEQIHP